MTLVLSSHRRTRVKDAASRGTVGEAREEMNTQGLVHDRAFPLPVSSEPEGGAEGANPGPLCAQGVASSPPSKSLPGLRGAAAPRSSSSPLSVHSTAHTCACRVTGACVCPNAHPMESDIVCTPTGEVPSVERCRVDSHCLSSRLVAVLVCKSLAVRTARALSYGGPCGHIPGGQTSTATRPERRHHPRFDHSRFPLCRVLLLWLAVGLTLSSGALGVASVALKI